MIIGVDPYNQCVTGDKAKSLNSAATDTDHIPCVTYSLDRAAFNQGMNAKYDFAVEKELAQPLLSTGPGGVCNEIDGGGTYVQFARLRSTQINAA